LASMWLFKSDPEHYSFTDLLRDGKAVWDGVSNNTALKNIRAIRRGDSVLVYHTGLERAVVGTAEVASNPYPDPKLKNPKLVVVDLTVKEKLPRPVTLSEIKAEAGRNEALLTFDLVRQPRLSVMPVSGEQWKAILALSKK
jgi:predicted RNA-binding protein with PUA-like domain